MSKSSLYLASAFVMLELCAPVSSAEHIVIMHTNDTHSQIVPAHDGKGGVARRKVVIDSIRSAEPYTLLIDAGDAVQGSNYFTLYGGEVEATMLNALGYDYAILGNHEFDNGMEALGKYVSSVSAPYISTNYVVTGTPLEGLLERYQIVPIAGKRIGLIAINLEPHGMIADDKSEGIVYQDPYNAANSTAWHLKHNEGVDYVIAVTHVGYRVDPLPDDIKLAANSSDIDIIIGGHSHTLLVPGTDTTLLPNRDGKEVLVAQSGSSGAWLGVVTIDTDSDTFSSGLIAIDERLDDRIDNSIVELLEPYRHGVDSLQNIVVGKSLFEAPRGDISIVNFMTDAVDWIGRGLNDGKPVDLTVANRGGIRTPMNKGNITRGGLMEMFPFDNRVVILELKGSDVLDVFQTNLQAPRVGFSRPVEVVVHDGQVAEGYIDGIKVDPDKVYLVATIDYLANGGDYMTPLTRGNRIAGSKRIVNLDIIDYVQSLKKRTVRPDKTNRFTIR